MKPLLSTLLIVLAMLTSSCGCLRREQARIGFTQAQKQFFPPYKKSSTYSFIDLSGQIVDFKVTKEKWWSQDDLLDDAMCTDYASFEHELIELKSDSSAIIRLWIELRRYETDENGNFDGILRWDGSCRIQLCTDIIFPHWKSYLSSVGINIDKEGFLLTNPYTTFHESMEIDGQVYQDVVETREMVCTDDNKKVPTQIFYNKDYGLIQLNVDNKNYLTLKR